MQLSRDVMIKAHRDVQQEETERDDTLYVNNKGKAV